MNRPVVALLGEAAGRRSLEAVAPSADVRFEHVNTVAALRQSAADETVDCVVVAEAHDGTSIGSVLETVGDVDDQLPCLLLAGGTDSAAAVPSDHRVEHVRVVEESASDESFALTAICAARWHRLQQIRAGNAPAPVVEFTRRVIDEAPIGITLTDPSLPDNPMVYANERFTELTGYDLLEVLGRNHRLLQGPETDPEAVATLASAVEDERSVSTELVNYRSDGQRFWNRVQIAPLYHDELAYFVGFQTDVTDRKKAEERSRRRAEELSAERHSLQRVLSRIDGLFQTVTSTAMSADTATELKREICERITKTPEYGGAWIGQRELTSDRLVAQARAGCGDVESIAVDLSAPDTQSAPAARAVTEQERVIAHGEQLSTESVHRRFTGSQGGIGAVPLRYRDSSYGVLVVYAEHASTFDEHEQAVLESIGTVVATGLNAIESRRLLTAEECLELQFETVERSLPVVALSASLDTTVEYHGSSPCGDGRHRIAMLVGHNDSSAVREAVETSLDGVEPTLLTSYDGRCFLEIETERWTLSQSLAEHNARLRSFVATDGQGTIDVELPSGADPRPLVERLRSSSPDTELLSQHTRTRRSEDEHWSTVGGSVRERLTDRQYTVLRKAYLSGYFERPRPVSGDELADSLGITRATFHQHLRVAQRKLVDALFQRQQRSVDLQE